eukprot:TRINITY_DN27359_c0_g1_i2.p1 TRINITY_DN27359_c0_g1~~TRINITY_DN27359_c0_g1_i2.p1  ORF type:complete len:1288 (+),score=118.64 TRINITY_DN27359_c0_g1_i2:78-3866(+)
MKLAAGVRVTKSLLLLSLWFYHGNTTKPLCRSKYNSSSSSPDDVWRDCIVQIGGLAIRGADAFNKQLGPTFQTYLSNVLNASHGLEFQALPLNFNQNIDYVSRHDLDFIYSNPAAYTCLMVQYKLTTVASLINFRKGNSLGKFAGVIFTQANSSFRTIDDLRTARISAVSISGLGAMQLQQAELLARGLNVMTDVNRLTFTGNQKVIIDHVQNNVSDIGFVRTDMIDRSVAEGKTKWEYFRVINEVADSSFPFKRSTAFTPEWPLGALTHVPNEVKRIVGQALMALDRDSADPVLSGPAVNGSFKTWVTPMNYLELLGMLESIKYYNPEQRRCLHNSDVYQAIRCPSGYVKRSEDSAFCSDCQSGLTCLCSPCSKLSDPELVMSSKPLNSSWFGAVNLTQVDALSSFSNDCKRMQLCVEAAVGQSIRWTILDQIGKNNRLKISAPLLKKVEIRTSFQDMWQNMSVSNYTLGGLESQQYTFDIVASKAGTQVVEILINGQQAPMSPVIANFVDAPLKVITCAAGMQPEGNTGLCANCTSGSAGTGGADLCKLCDPGTMQPLDGQAHCVACPVGKYATSRGASACLACPAGKSTRGKAASRECSFCEPGQYASSEGMERCKPCSRGTYSERDGATSCNQCFGGQTTMDLGSVTNASCGCDKGQYWARNPAGNHTCRLCPEIGTHCPFFDSPPLVASGFYMEKDAPKDAWDLDLWRCISTGACPGQLNQSDPICFGDLRGTNCALCPDGTNKSGNECAKCSVILGVFLFPLVTLFAFFAFGAYHCLHERFLQNKDLKKRYVLGPVVFGVGIAYFQALGIYKKFGFYWPDLFLPFLDMSDLVLLNVEVVRVPCMIKQSLTSAYLVPLFLPLIAALFIFAWLPVSRCMSGLSNGKMNPFTTSGLLNSAGKVWQAVYIAIVTITMSIFDCYASPNGKTTVRAFPYATCEGSEYYGLLPVAILGILVYVAGFFAVCIWLQHVAPHRFGDTKFRKSTSFLFFKFSPHCWWYGIIIHFRSLALATVTTVAPDYAFIQFMLSFVILLVSIVCHVRYSPYLDSYSNFLETCVISLLITTVTLGSWFSEERHAKEDDFLESLLAGLLIAASVGTIFALLLGGLVAVLLSTLTPAYLKNLKIAQRDFEVSQVKEMGSTLHLAHLDDLAEMMETASSEDVRALRAVVNLVKLEIDDHATELEKKRLPSRRKSCEKISLSQGYDSTSPRGGHQDPGVEVVSRPRPQGMFSWFFRGSNAQVAVAPQSFDAVNCVPRPQ